MNHKYEKTIKLITLWRALSRRWNVLLIVFAPISLATIIYTQAIIKKTYQSSATFINNNNLNVTQHGQVVLQITKTETIQKTVESLANASEPIIIDSNYILSGLNIASYDTNNSGIISFSFTSTNKEIVKPILSTLEEVAIEEIRNNGFPSMSYKSRASNPVKTSKEDTYLIAGLAISLLLGYGFAFLYEIISDEVFDKSDIETLGCSGFEFTVSK